MTTVPVLLSELGSDPASVLRLVAQFDALEEQEVNADAAVRFAALIAGCPVGVRWPGGTVVRYDASGRLDPIDDGASPASDRPETAVWVERDGSGHPLDEVLLDRLRRLVSHVAARTGVSGTPHLGDPALLEVVLSAKEHREDRARAIRLLGLDETRPTCVLAASGHSPRETLRLITDELAAPTVRSAVIGNATAVVCQGSFDMRELSDRLERLVVEQFPAVVSTGTASGPWIGIGSVGNAFSASTSWHEAVRALRFASSTGFGRRVVAYERLSSLELLADLPIDRVRRNRDVARINEIASTPAGDLDVRTAEAFFVYGSLRRTATELHVHHSTVAARVARVQAAMGWDFEDPVDRFLGTLVLTIRRIAMSSAELADADLL
ncbi:helix-turn-helix domain-containing protein [Mycolicibacterium septicum]|uniref:PucR family transcriptional regulator n=1 Tax=Mycolicibacterium septicum TaxID=98668 RepID=UPI0023E21DD2|nr:helix-turn-helix domain-containing protein [Mycolicibacterium septicum]MDF3337219.1 helix-turn-helix domain-containing protein [Mycolicibacterium septicum]